MAVSISGVSGTLTHGSAVVIAGSGFGSKATAAPMMWDTVDNQAAYSALSDGQTIPTGGGNPWPDQSFTGNGDEIKYSTTGTRGVRTAQYKTTNDTKGYLANLTWTKTNYTYTSWWWKSDTDISVAGHSSKLVRFSDSAAETTKTFSWTQIDSYIFNDPDYPGGQYHTFDFAINTWHFLEVWFDSVQQIYSVRVDGDYQVQDSPWTGSTIQFNELWKIGYDGGGTDPGPPAISLRMNEIYVDSTLSRVMLGNAATYAACTAFEMQPPTAWAAGEITVTLNRGAFAADGTPWVYVVDSAGTVNANGFQITLGGEGGGGLENPGRYKPAPFRMAGLMR